ncbi:two-component system, OmpR family, response regulator [Methylobacterium gossipiicola]|uniref:Two-component system, OmpR family, response regulator n=1 Tax=Methylobacterium gossipiicola TaxID=582675 RepID=A0A1I2X5W4_9HYPH|nr:two-component system, OmpR family, response regulator [Methylobacterium gossipiicola]
MRRSSGSGASNSTFSPGPGAGARALDLLPREFKLLEYLMRRSGQVVTRAMMFEEVWNYRFAPKSNLIDVHVGRLRKKLDGPGESVLIHNVRGEGFTLTPDV